MMKKILAIAWKDNYQIFTDRSLLLLMFITPLVISTIVALVFGGDGGAASLSNIPVVVVNQDVGIVEQEQRINYGQQFISLLMPPQNSDDMAAVACPLLEDATQNQDTTSPIALYELIDLTQLDDPQAARDAVDNGDYAAAIIIPSEFSQAFRVDPITISAQPTIQVEVYGSQGVPISASVVRAVVDSIINTNKTGSIAINTALTTLIQLNPAVLSQLQTADDTLQPIYACGFSPDLGIVTINQQPIISGDARSLFEVILLSVGASQAVFFALFSAQFGVLNIIEERRAGTLQRLFVSPTTRFEILTGKLFGTFGTVVFQLSIMLLALTLVSSLLTGTLTNIWGTNIIGIITVVLALSFAATGIAMLLAGFTTTPEQAGPIGGVINIVLAMLGGAFGVTFGPPLSYLSLIYWGTNALDKLSAGSTDILLNLIILLGQGVLFFGIGLILFNRRAEV
ncbi:MAG: ABC transporter permease [Chloroflexi bacterium]|nr:MAG: ABC transporter permease [Chloroflexota bacterium]